MLEQDILENPDVVFQGQPYSNLGNTKNRSQQNVDPNNITNTLEHFIITYVNKIYNQTVNDTKRSKTPYMITKLKPDVMEESDDEKEVKVKVERGGKRSRKRRRSKKKTRKTGKNKKRASRINKKRIGKKTRKNI